MKMIVSSPDKEAEKRLIRVLAEIALEVGREESDDEKSCRVLSCIDSNE